jgi:hypothetical protein
MNPNAGLLPEPYCRVTDLLSNWVLALDQASESDPVLVLARE